MKTRTGTHSDPTHYPHQFKGNLTVVLKFSFSATRVCSSRVVAFDCHAIISLIRRTITHASKKKNGSKFFV